MQGEAAEIKKAPRGILSMQLQIKKKKKKSFPSFPNMHTIEV